MEENIKENELVVLEFRRKRSIKELKGLIKLNHPTNSVELRRNYIMKIFKSLLVFFLIFDLLYI